MKDIPFKRKLKHLKKDFQRKNTPFLERFDEIKKFFFQYGSYCTSESELELILKFKDAAEKVMKDAEGPEAVAKTIFKAATDNSNKMRYAVGKPGPMLLKLRKLLSDKFYFLLVRKSYNI